MYEKLEVVGWRVVNPSVPDVTFTTHDMANLYVSIDFDQDVDQIVPIFRVVQ